MHVLAILDSDKLLLLYIVQPDKILCSYSWSFHSTSTNTGACDKYSPENHEKQIGNLYRTISIEQQHHKYHTSHK